MSMESKRRGTNRRYLAWTIVFVEFGLAVALAAFAWSLPGSTDVKLVAQRAEAGTGAAVKQVQELQKTISDLRRPELLRVIDQLEQHTTTVATMLKGQSIDFATLKVVHDSLGDFAKGLDVLAKTIEKDRVQTLADGLGHTADFLDATLAPGAEQAARDIETATVLLQKNGKALQEFMAKAPLDLEAVQKFREALKNYSSTIIRIEGNLRTWKIDKIVDGVQGATGTVETLAKTADTFFLKEKAQELRDAAEGLKSIEAIVVQLDKEVMPDVQRSLADTRKILDGIGQTLDVALKQQAKIEPVVKELPNQIGQMAEKLPQIGMDLAKVLRETGRIKGTAQALRQAQQQVNTVVTNWPQIQGSLGRTSDLLRASQKQMAVAIKNQPTYEVAVKETASLTDAFAAMLPVFKSQLNVRLDEEDRLLGEIESACTDAKAAIPAIEGQVSTSLQFARLVFWFGALIPLAYALQHLFTLVTPIREAG